MKKLVTLLTVGCCLIMSSALFSSNFDFINKSGDEKNMSSSEVMNPSFYASTESGDNGDATYVAVRGKNFTNVATFAWTMWYDSTIIRLDSAFNEHIVTGQITLPAFGHFRYDPTGFRNVNFNSIGYPLPHLLPPSSEYPAGTNKAVTVIWFNPSGAPVSKPDDTDIFYLGFTFIGNPGDVSPIAFSDKPTDIDVTDGATSYPLTLTDFTNSTATVNGGGGNNPGPLRFNLSGGTLAESETKCFSVSTTGFDQITGFNTEMTWDQSVLKYTEVKSINLSGLSQSNIDASGANSGSLKIDYSSSGTSVNNGTDIYEVCFEAVGSGGSSSNVSLGQDGNNVPTSNAGTISLTASSSTISIDAPQTNCGTLNGLSFYASNESVEPGQPAYLAVRGKDFNNVATFAWTMWYDSTIIRLDSAFNENLTNGAITIPAFGHLRHDPTGFRNVNFNSIGFPLPRLLPPVSQYPAGTNKAVTVIWFNPSGAGISKPDCEDLFYLAYTAIGNLGEQSPIVFSDLPTDIDITDGVTSYPVDLNDFVDGSITIEQKGVSVNLGSITMEQGETKCVPVSVRGFENIKHLQNTISFNKTQLEYKNVRALNLQGLAANNFTLNGSQNKLSVNWDAVSPAGVTVADNTVIYEVCFEAIAAGGTNSTVRVTDSPTDAFATDADDENFDIPSASTTVSIELPAGQCGSLTGRSFYGSHETVLEDETAFFAVRGKNFNDVATFAWTMWYDSTIIRVDSAFNEDINTGGITIPAFGHLRYPGPNGLRNVNFNSIGFPLPRLLPPVSQYPAGTNKAVTVIWFNPSGAPISKPDCEDLFYIAYKAIGNAGDKSPVVFSELPTEIDVTDGVTSYPLTLADFLDGSVEIIDDAQPPGAPDDVDITDVNCKGDATGAISLTYPAGPYNFAWDGGLNGKDIINLEAGTIGLTITDSDTGLSSTFSYNVSEPATALTASGSITNEINCFGDDNGAISISANGGTGSYSYNWTPNVVTGANPSNLGPGTYSVEVSDDNGCTAQGGSFTLTEPTRLSIPNPTITDVSCGGGNDGQISLIPTGGSTPYSYNWTGGLTPVRNPSGLTEGSYSVTVTDSKNCEAFGTYSVGASDPIVINLVNITHSTNGNNGSISTTCTGGSTQFIPLIISWTGPNGFFSDQSNIQNLSPGQYCKTVMDEKGCSITECFDIENRVPKAQFDQIVLNESCAGESTGSISVTFTGGVAPIVTIKNGAGQIVGNGQLAAGIPGSTNYMIELTDQGQICDQRTVFLREYSQIVVSGNVLDDIGTGGSIDVNATNTVGALSFDWTPNLPDTPNPTGLQAGTYIVVVTDQSTGCSGTETFVIEDKRPVVIDESQTTAVHVKCPDGNDGSISVFWTQGVGPFTVTLNGANPQTVGANQNFVTLPGLDAGDYIVTVVDANGNSSSTSTITINEPNAFTASAKITPQTSALGGTIDLTVTGGTQPYTFMWNDNNNQTVEDPTNLQNGPYTCIVKDANGCEFRTQSFTVGSFRFENSTAVDSDCAASENGSITVIVEGGTLPYTYDWTFNGSAFGGNSASILDLAPGNYSVVVTETNGAVITENFVVGTASKISATAAIVSDVECFGGSNGSANVIASDGATPYSYQWNAGTNPDAQQVSGLPAGTATVIVTDNLGCQTTASVLIQEPSQINVVADVTGNLCFGDAGGEIELNVSGGNPSAGSPRYFVFWDDADQEGLRLRGLRSGEYTGVLEDANGCEESISVIVDGPTLPLTPTIEFTNDDGSCSGTARAEVIGGTAPYFYHWSVEADTTERELAGLCSGDYFLTVTDANGCSKVATMASILNDGIECLSTRAVITPDGEGRNEEFIIYCIEQYPDNTLEIYNRWGQLVWEQDNYDNTWSGRTLRGSDVPDGAYFFVFRYNEDGQIKQKKGSFTLLRK